MSVIVPLQRMNRGSHFRAYSLRSDDMIAPFLGVDHAWMNGPTFPPHPHEGFSAVSYLFLDSETGINNRDNIGTHNLIRPGGLHWTTAGRGVIHEEVPAETGKTVHSLQIFVDLPPERKSIEPFPLMLEPQDVPVVQLPGVKVRVPIGGFADARSPLSPPTDVTMLDISLEEGAKLVMPVAADHGAFVMPIFGTAVVNDQSFEHNDLQLPVFPAQGEPRAIVIQAPHGTAKVVLFSGRPLHAQTSSISKEFHHAL
ncbi:pirin family protein [Aeromonas dhakensis]|uniref:pirin family protein n=1 Tax=Aeromonas dhakensis TaxID=196024 RepID=UPI00208E99C8|nr:pirin family protein [Aeromonas dhakensis]USP11867.1 pirin family protein [Aeromonas dhakensis]